MYFRDLSIHSGSFAEMPQGFKARDFNFSCHHVQEIFLLNMPRKYTLDGMAKTNIECGRSSEEQKYVQLIDVNKYTVEDFDMYAYFEAQPERRQEIVLETIKNALLDIAGMFGADEGPIIAAHDAVQECGYRQVFETKLTRSTKSRKTKLRVCREINSSGDDWYILFSNRGGDILKKEYIAKSTTFLDASYKYYKSGWDGNEYYICDRLGDRVYSIIVDESELHN